MGAALLLTQGPSFSVVESATASRLAEILNARPEPGTPNVEHSDTDKPDAPHQPVSAETTVGNLHAPGAARARLQGRISSGRRPRHRHSADDSAMPSVAVEAGDSEGHIDASVLRLCGLPTTHLYHRVMLLSAPNFVLESMAEKLGFKTTIAPDSSGGFFSGFKAEQFLRGAPLEPFYLENPPIKVGVVASPQSFPE